MPHKPDASAASVLGLSLAKPVGRSILTLLLLGLAFSQASAQNTYSPYGPYSPYSRRGQAYASGYVATPPATQASDNTSLTSYVSDYAGAPAGSPEGTAVEQSAPLAPPASPPAAPPSAKPWSPTRPGAATAAPATGETINPGYSVQPPANPPAQPSGTPYAPTGAVPYGGPGTYGGPYPGGPCPGDCCGGECYGGGENYGGDTPLYSALSGGFSTLYGPLQNRLYGSAEYLLWWTKGDHLPALVTSSDPGTTQADAGILGLASTHVLFGSDEVNDQYRSGVRLTLGGWLDPCQRAGFEVTYLKLGDDDQSTNFNSTTTPILAVPFTNVLTGNPDAVLVAYPGVSTGSIDIKSVSKFETVEALLRRNLYQDRNAGMDFLMGYRYARLTDSITMNDSVTGVGEGGIVPVGTTLAVTDSFGTDNAFNGVDIGFNGQIRRCAWTLDMLMKLGLGTTRSITTINGNTKTTSAGTTTTSSGGLLALSSNINSYSSNQFSIMPELGLTVGYDFTSRLRGTLGYSFIYWSQVHRAGEQIDTNVNPNLFPPPVTTNVGLRQPQYLNATNDFWAQGLNVGLEYSF